LDESARRSESLREEMELTLRKKPRNCKQTVRRRSTPKLKRAGNLATSD
jgi:hypothetical protein